MNTYEKVYNALSELCSSERLNLVEAELSNEKICYARMNGKILINKRYHKFERIAKGKVL